MYLVSPFYVKWIYKNPSKAFNSTVAITILSTALSMLVFYNFCACPEQHLLDKKPEVPVIPKEEGKVDLVGGISEQF